MLLVGDAVALGRGLFALLLGSLERDLGSHRALLGLVALGTNHFDLARGRLRRSRRRRLDAGEPGERQQNNPHPSGLPVPRKASRIRSSYE